MATKKAKRAGKAKAAKKAAKRGPHRAAKEKAAPKRARPARAKPVVEVKEPDLRGDFLRLVSKLGAGEAQRLLDTFVEVETPRRSRPLE